ncbi:MAG TPA: glycogen-binding domain-containing protein [Gemmatimonadaceae bacterium]|nr:glycogen-binding domain-containing protein [Gemmatimonadaceae bacterium]
MVEHHDDRSEIEDAAFLDRVARSLRAPERAHASFERRVMEKVRAEGATLYPPTLTHKSWWRTSRAFNVTPLTAVAMAASALIVVAASGIVIGSRVSSNRVAPQAAAAAPTSDTVQVVRFVFVDPKASTVQLVGDFNEWQKGSTQLKPSGAPGVWTVSVPLSEGRHEYAFIVDGTRWVADPLAVKSTDDFGTESSVIRVASAGKSTT